MKLRLALSAVSLLLALVVYVGPNQRFASSADDWSYLFQARLFASGHIYAQDPLYDKANPLQRYLGTNCITDDQGRRFSKYPPGWPLLLAVGSAVGAEWLAAPLLGALLVFLVLGEVEREIGREWVARAWLLLALCAFFTYTLQSFRSHTATMLFLFAAFLLYRNRVVTSGSNRAEVLTDSSGRTSVVGSGLQKRQNQRTNLAVWSDPISLVAGGALVGYVALIRYVDWIPLALWITWDLLRRRRVGHLVLFGLAFAAIASGNLLYDALLTGHPFVTPTALSAGAGPHDHLVLSWRGFLVTAVRLGAVLYVFPPVLVLALLTRDYWRRAPFKPHAALFLMSVALYFSYVAAIGGPGPRYLSAYFPFLVVLAVDAWRWLHRRIGAISFARLWRSAIVAQLLASLVFAAIEVRRVYERKDLDRAIGRLESGPKIIVLKTGPRGETWADFTRNPPVLSSTDTLVLGWGDGLRLDQLASRFPGRHVFVYRYPGHIDRR